MQYSHDDLTLNFDEMSRNLYRIRSKSMPPSPKTTDDIVLHYQDKQIMKDFGTSTVILSAIEFSTIFKFLLMIHAFMFF